MRLLISILIIFLLTPIKNLKNSFVVGPSSSLQKQYSLIWADEFNNDGSPDTTKWGFENGFKRNNEAQWYQKENAICLGGNLVITGKKEHHINPNYMPNSTNWRTNRKYIDYTSASLIQKKAFAFKYGRVEVRAKIKAKNGLWPAIWTLGVNGGWPNNGECDIMEYYNGGILANFAHGSSNPTKPIWNSSFKNVKFFDDPNWDANFHIWRLDWDENSMKIYVDDLLLNSINLVDVFNTGSDFNPFRQKHYLLLNLALGGDKGGDLSNTDFPSQYLIDYVRVYQKN
jgi:beta-glucanase (GH16 family)